MTPIRLQRDAPPRRRCLQKRRKNIFGPPTAPSFSKTTTSAPLFPPFHNPSPQKPFRYEISGLEHFHKSYSNVQWLITSGLFGFWRRFSSVAGLFKPAPSPKPRQKPKILAAHRYIISVNALM
jgi:hypothetical protein